MPGSSVDSLCKSSCFRASTVFFSSWSAACRAFNASVALQMSASSSVSLRSSRVLVTRPSSAVKVLRISAVSGESANLIKASSLPRVLLFVVVRQAGQTVSLSSLSPSVRDPERSDVIPSSGRKEFPGPSDMVPWKREAVRQSSAACPPSCPSSTSFSRTSIHPLHRRLRDVSRFATNACTVSTYPSTQWLNWPSQTSATREK